jgi:two-component system, sensor histidine kinase and response regulator
MHEKSHARLVAYGVAVLATAITLFVRLLLWPVLGDAVAHMFFFPAVMIAAYYGGFAPGLLSTVLGALAANYFFTEPRYSLQIKNLNAAIALPLFVLVGTIISGLCEVLHRARRATIADERRRADETLRETEERFQQLAENIHEIFWIRDAQNDRLTYVSPGVEVLWGITPPELYANPTLWFERIHPDDRQAVMESWRHRKRGEFTTLESRLVRPDGSIRWIRSRAFPITKENGTITRIAGLTEDITERKRAEEVLRAAEARFRALIDHATDAILLVDRAEGTILDVNCQACGSLGYTRDELLGKTVFDIDPTLTVAQREQYLARQGSEDTIVFDTRHRRKDGSTFPVEIRLRSMIVDGRQCN